MNYDPLEVKQPSVRQAYYKGGVDELRKLNDFADYETDIDELKYRIQAQLALSEKTLASFIDEYQPVQNDSFNGVY